MIYDMIGNEVHSAPKQTQVKYIEGKNVSQFYTRGNGSEVTAVMKALPQDRYTCIQEVVACLKTGMTNTYRVSIYLKKSFFTRRVYEYAKVIDYLDNIVFESKRQVVQKPKPFNIAQVIG